MAQQNVPNQAANKEPAEGSRENVNAPDNAGGITNRPLDEERQKQSKLPARGHSKDEDPVMPGDESALNTKISTTLA